MIYDDDPVSGGVLVFCTAVLFRISYAYVSPGMLLKWRFWFSESGWGLRFCMSNKLLDDTKAASLRTTFWTAKLDSLLEDQQRVGFPIIPAHHVRCRNFYTGATARWPPGLCPGIISTAESLSQAGGRAWMVFTLGQDFSLMKPLIIRLVCRIEQSWALRHWRELEACQRAGLKVMSCFFKNTLCRRQHCPHLTTSNILSIF